MVVDVRFSSLQLAVDPDCVVKSTPFFKYVQGDSFSDGGAGGRGVCLAAHVMSRGWF